MTSLDRALKKIAASLDDFAAHGLLEAAQFPPCSRRISTSRDLEDAAAAQLVIEAVTEDLPLKLEIFGKLDRICPPPAVLGSSSGQPASALIAEVQHPERVIATHFWYPPQLIPLVEVCAGPETSPDVMAWVCAVLKRGRQGARRHRQGNSGLHRQPAAIRHAARGLGAVGIGRGERRGHRHGGAQQLRPPRRHHRADRVGRCRRALHDVSLRQLAHAASRHVAEPPAAIAELVAKGANGLANGQGVYDWSKRDGDALIAARMEELFRWLKADKARRA